MGCFKAWLHRGQFIEHDRGMNLGLIFLHLIKGKDDTEGEAQNVSKQVMDEDDKSDEEDESDEEDNYDEDDKDDSEEDGEDNDEEDNEDDEDQEEELNNGRADPHPDAKLPNRTSFRNPLPDGCQLADSRITCQGLYITHLPNISGPGVTAFQLSGEEGGVGWGAGSQLKDRGCSGIWFLYPPYLLCFYYL